MPPVTKGFRLTMTETPSNTSNLEVWYDGECALCRKSRSACEIRDPRGLLNFADFRKVDDHELPVSRRDHEETLWARTPEGALLKGFDAWRRILAELPRWRWLARLTGTPPIPVVGRAVYSVVARFRRTGWRRNTSSNRP